MRQELDQSSEAFPTPDPQGPRLPYRSDDDECRALGRCNAIGFTIQAIASKGTILIALDGKALVSSRAFTN